MQIVRQDISSGFLIISEANAFASELIENREEMLSILSLLMTVCEQRTNSCMYTSHSPKLPVQKGLKAEQTEEASAQSAVTFDGKKSGVISKVLKQTQN